MRNSAAAALSVACTLAVCLLTSTLTKHQIRKAEPIPGLSSRLRYPPGKPPPPETQPPSTVGATTSAPSAPKPPPSPSDLASFLEDVPYTVKKCTRMDAWGDVCVYENVCFGRGPYQLPVLALIQEHNVGAIGDAGAPWAGLVRLKMLFACAQYQGRPSLRISSGT